MRPWRWVLLFVVLAVVSMVALFVASVHVATGAPTDPALTETRYCGEPKRNLSGEIIRRSAVRDAFQRIHPCPSNGNREGPCPRYQRNHPYPLACGGCDSVTNMEWMRADVKRIHDSYERKIYGGMLVSASCKAVPPGGIR